MTLELLKVGDKAPDFSIPNQDGNMIRCDRCGKRAIIFTRYSGLHLCENHFDEFFMKRVKREIR